MEQKYSYADLPFVAIIGSPRSGTSMLRTMFDAHSHVSIPTEYPFIHLYYSFFGSRKFYEEEITFFLKLIQIKIKYRFWDTKRWRIQFKDLELALLAESDLDFHKAVKILIAHFNSVFSKSDIRVLMIKEPLYTYVLPEIKKIIPEIKCIALIRDPRAQVNSVRKKDFGSKLITANALAWHIAQKKILRFEKKYSNSLLKIRYEDMINERESTIDLCCHFSGIEFEPQMLTYYEKSEEIAAAYSFQKNDASIFHRSTLQEPNPLKISEWRNQLSKRDIKIIEVINGRLMKKIGYERMYKKNHSLLVLYVPVYIHFMIQGIIGRCMRILPPAMRIKIFSRSSLFEKSYASIFGKSLKNESES